MEGVTLVTVPANRGLTEGDLAGVVGIGLGVRQAWPDLVRRWTRVLLTVCGADAAAVACTC